jgi:hypothetical protein
VLQVPAVWSTQASAPAWPEAKPCPKSSTGSLNIPVMVTGQIDCCDGTASSVHCRVAGFQLSACSWPLVAQ